ncbi:MAG TPA: helix-turn-helix domain-containing protein [Microlunatus sp.]
MTEREISFVAPDVSQLKALAHPVRMRMLGMLRLDGPATATQLAQRLGLNSGATSYHLRQLAQHGYIEEDGERGNKRDRWWRASHESTHLGAAKRPESPADRDAIEAFWQALAIAHLDTLSAGMREHAELPDAWAEVSDSSDWAIWLTPDQADELLTKVHAVLDETLHRAPADADDAPADAEQFLIQVHGFPRPGRVVGGHRP